MFFIQGGDETEWIRLVIYLSLSSLYSVYILRNDDGAVIWEWMYLSGVIASNLIARVRLIRLA